MDDLKSVQENDIDSLLKDEVTPGSQPENKADATPAPAKSEEELEFAKLKGPTQERIRQLIREKNEALAKAEAAKQPYTPAPLQPHTATSAEQQEALETLKKFGVVTRDDIQALEDKLIVEKSYSDLSKKYDGSNGLPAFDKTEIEDHMKRTGIYNPEAAYKNLYEEEIFDWKAKAKNPKKQPYTNTSRSNARGNEISADSIQERLSRPDGAQWWEKNRAKILPLLGELSKE